MVLLLWSPARQHCCVTCCFLSFLSHLSVPQLHPSRRPVSSHRLCYTKPCLLLLKASHRPHSPAELGAWMSWSPSSALQSAVTCKDLAKLSALLLLCSPGRSSSLVLLQPSGLVWTHFLGEEAAAATLRSKDNCGSGPLMVRAALLEIPSSLSVRISLGEILKARTLCMHPGLK